MSSTETLPLKVVDGLELPMEYRQALRPGEVVVDETGRRHRFPRFLYEINSWQSALETELAPCFRLHEFISTDVREASILRGFPRYVPLAVTHIAAHLSVLRHQVGTYMHIAANGGYRSPSHRTGPKATPHRWGTAVNICRIGDDYLDTPDTVRRYTSLVNRFLPGAWVRPYGVEAGETIDHLHIDLGIYVLTPRDAGSADDVDSGGTAEDEGRLAKS
jgi:hypothetical protein